MDYKQILSGLLSTAYKNDGGKLVALLENNEENQTTTEDFLKQLLSADANRITSIKEEANGKFQDGYKKGKVESLTELEKSLKENYSVVKDSDLRGVDLINQIVKASSVTKEITENDVLLHPTYQNMIGKLKAEKETAINEVKTEFETFKSGIAKAKTFETIESKLFSLRDSLNAVIPQSKERALKTEQNLRRDLESYDFQITDNGTILILQDGNVMKDTHGNTIDFETFGKSHIQNYYEFAANNGGGNPGGGADAGAGAGEVSKAKVFNNASEVYNYLESDITPDEKMQVIEANKHLLDN